MSGTIYHSREFVKSEYLGADGHPHFEVRCVDGQSLGLSHASWNEMKSYGEANGMPLTAWPEFLDHEFAIDLPLEEARERQALFRQHLLQLPLSDTSTDYWLAHVVEWVRRGEVVFFCGC
jgi:hypothetical protein